MCGEAGRLFALLKSGINIHSEKKNCGPLRLYRSSSSHLGAHYAHLVCDASLRAIGATGSGTSVAASRHLAFFPRDGRCDLRAALVFEPSPENAFLFTGKSPLAPFVELNYFRAPPSKFSPPAILILGEFAETKSTQDSGVAAEVAARLRVSANFVAARGKRKGKRK